MPLDAAARALVAPYVSSLDDDVFALTGLPEEVIAVLFAYYSRSKDDLRTNLARLLVDDDLDVAGGASARVGFASEKARAFHEKWVVGYGHSSVAEHAVVHLALENVSIVASKVIEDLRLGSYTEKSTRYVVFDRGSLTPLPWLPDASRALYEAAGTRLFETYHALMPRALEALEARMPRGEKQTQGAYAAALRAAACDALRGLLPAGTKTNVGLTANARAMEMLLSKMLSSEHREVLALGEAMRAASLHVAPTLVKYARPNEFRSSRRAAIGDAIAKAGLPLGAVPQEAGALAQRGARNGARVLRHDADALERIASALAYEHGDLDAAHVARAIEAGGRPAAEALVRAAVAKRSTWDAPPRAFEASSLTVELVLDYGAYRDLQRHRMLTPHTQHLGASLGYETPAELVEFGLEAEYAAAIEQAADAHEELVKSSGFPRDAQYVLPLAFRMRTLWTLNVRELFHVCELRSARQGHASYRRIAQDLYRAAARVHPWLEGLVRVDLEDYALARS